MSHVSLYTYAQRLRTFEGYWDEHLTTARQLAAIGHIYDRPPLEVLEEGSRCISCSAFVRRDLSIKAFGDRTTGSRSYEDDFDSFIFHHPTCTRLQVRIPLDPQALLPGLHGYRLESLRNKFERRAVQNRASPPSERLPQSSSLFNLPTEIRLEIYAMLLPSLDSETEIVTLNRDSARVITRIGSEKTGPRDTTKQNILRTCKAVNDEAMDLLYSHTTFQFRSTKVMYLFLRSIGKDGRQLIKYVDVQCGSREDAIAFALLASCDKLQTIIIRLPRAVILFPRAPIWCKEGMSCLLGLSGVKEVKFGYCKSSFNYMDDTKADASIIRTALMRQKGTPFDVVDIDRYSDI